MADYSADTPYECSRYVYNVAGERVAWLEARAHSDAQTYGRKGRRDMQILQPASLEIPDTETRFAEQMAQRFLWVNLMPWRHRSHADQWAVQLDKDEDLKTYLEWFPQLALPIEAAPGEDE